MRSHKLYITLGTIAATILGAVSGMTAEAPEIAWQVVANNGYEIPGHPGRFYNSYNPPSVNAQAVVVFRARSTGRQGGPVSGIYIRDMGAPGGAVQRVADRVTAVPDPNNTRYPLPGGQGEHRFATFNEFPSIPRIAIGSDAIATRGNHEPVWTWVVGQDPVTGEDEETRGGSTGVYFSLAGRDPNAGPLTTGASLLAEVGQGAYLDFSYVYRVPGVEPVTRFEVFPGSPSITEEGIVVFKGNYTDPVSGAGRTGVFYRRIVTDYGGGAEPIKLLARSGTVIPNPGDCPAGTTFGSTAPPSAAAGHAVFVGLDDEANPTCGGIYRAPLAAPAERLETLIGLGTAVPARRAGTISRVGEGLSYDGRFLGFWAAWGQETRTLRLHCPEEGNRIRRDFCNHAGEFAPDPESGEIRGDVNSICDDTTDPLYPRCYQEKAVPANQGIFLYDTRTRRLRLIARVGVKGRYDDFVYWNYSGAPPGAGHGEGHAEPPRFRSSAFLAVAGRAGATARIVFLARRGELDEDTGRWTDPVDGIYLADSIGNAPISTRALLYTGQDGTLLDPAAVGDHDEDPSTQDIALPIASLALEREALRGDWLAITASMGTEEAGWAGIYLTDLGALGPPDIGEAR